MANSTFRHLYTDTVDGVFGPKNYIKNAFARENVSGWATYADAAQSTPVDGTGGSPNITLTRNTSSPLRNEADFLITKDAANRQGQGVSYDFTIDNADKNQKMAILFDYSGSTNFVSGSNSDIQAFMFDVTNLVLIPLERNSLLVAAGTFLATFQASSSTSYRLILHIATTNANAWTFEYTNVVVANQSSILNNAAGPTITDWTPYTITITATNVNPTKGTTSTDKAYWRRNGDEMEIAYDYLQTVAGNDGSGDYLFSLPPGYTIDFTKVADFTAGPFIGLGGCGVTNVSQNRTNYNVVPKAYDSTNLAMVMTNSNNIAFLSSAQGLFSLSSGSISFTAVRIPITQWTSNVAVANSGILTMSQILANGTNVTSTPTALGQYRTYKKDAAANTGTDDTPSQTQSSFATDGMRIFSFNFATGGTSGQPSRWEIFIGRNKSWTIQAYSSAGKVGAVDTDLVTLGTPANELAGLFKEYDQSTGVLIIDAIEQLSGLTSRDVGVSKTDNGGAFTGATDCYFDITVADNDFQIQLSDTQSEVILSGVNGNGSTNTRVIRFTSVARNVGSAITYADSATDGGSFTINEAGSYGITVSGLTTTASQYIGIMLNSINGPTSDSSTPPSGPLALQFTNPANAVVSCSAQINLNPGDIIRATTSGTAGTDSSNYNSFRIIKL